jgi:peptide/nickel transport system substrate-binding protein
VKVRRAALMALSQKPILDALVGNPAYYKVCGAVFVCNTPLGSEADSGPIVKGDDLAEAKKLLAESGYDGTPVVLMAPGDVVTLKAQPIVVAQQLRDAGFKVDLQATDWQTVVSRRASQKPPKEGGWNMFCTNWVAPDVMNPVSNVMLNGKGKKGGWFGWPEDSTMEGLIDKFVRATSMEDQKKIAVDIQKRAMEQVTYVPLGQYEAPSVWRTSLKGVLDGPATPIFWNIEKTES